MFVAALLLSALVSSATDVAPTTWSAVDGLGRFLPEYGTVGAPRKDKFVGLFFWTWHEDYSNDPSNAVNVCWASQGRGIGTINNQEVMDAHPEAKNDYNHPVWKNICRDGKIGSGHWSEPIWGYYYSTDEWVVRRQGLLIAEAGVDCVIYDTTNGIDMWEKGYMVVGRVFEQMRREGTPVPGFAFMMPINHVWAPEYCREITRKQMHMVWEKVYSKGLFKDVWFYWKGKPLCLGYPDALDPNDPLDRQIRDFFTFRPVQPLYYGGQTPIRKWGWLSVHPQAVYCAADGTPEQITVGVAQNMNQEYACQQTAVDEGRPCYGRSYVMNGEEVFGRSYTSKGFDPRPDAKLYGANFQEQWDRALQIDPEFVFVTGWNEWISAPRPVRRVPNGFSDQFDEEHSRDCEPSKGNLKDHYYYQLCANIRRFKGVEPVSAVHATDLDLEASAADWAAKAKTFRDWKKDLSPRQARGYYPYASDTGRNALEVARVSHDADYVYFEAVSPQPLSPKDGANWMRLLIRNNRLGATWEGFQFILNRVAPGEKAVLERSTGGWNWQTVAICDCRLDGRRFLVKIPRIALGVATPVFELRFKWCDNNLADGDILSLYTDGDAMPGGRFTFHYKADDLHENL